MRAPRRAQRKVNLIARFTHRPLVLHLLDDAPINVLQTDAERDLVTLDFGLTPLIWNQITATSHDS